MMPKCTSVSVLALQQTEREKQKMMSRERREKTTRSGMDEETRWLLRVLGSLFLEADERTGLKDLAQYPSLPPKPTRRPSSLPRYVRGIDVSAAFAAVSNAKKKTLADGRLPTFKRTSFRETLVRRVWCFNYGVSSVTRFRANPHPRVVAPSEGDPPEQKAERRASVCVECGYLCLSLSLTLTLPPSLSLSLPEPLPVSPRQPAVPFLLFFPGGAFTAASPATPPPPPPPPPPPTPPLSLSLSVFCFRPLPSSPPPLDMDMPRSVITGRLPWAGAEPAEPRPPFLALPPPPLPPLLPDLFASCERQHRCL